MKLRTYLLSIILILTLYSSFRAQSIVQGYVEKGGLNATGSPTIRVQQSFPNSTVTVYLEGTTTLVAIYSDSGLAIPKSNPFTADSVGFYSFYIANGNYTIQFSGTGIVTPFTKTINAVNGASGAVGGELSGTLPNPSVVTGTSASKILRLNSAAQIPAVDGSLITKIPRASSDNYLTTSVNDIKIPSQSLIYLLKDEFTAVNGISNVGRKPYPISNSPIKWGTGMGSWKILNNHLEPATSYADGDYDSIDVGVSDFILHITLTSYVNSSAGVIFRRTDANNFWLVQSEVSGNRVALYENVAGVFNLRDSIPVTLAAGVPIDVSITTYGNSINVEVPDINAINYSSANNNTATVIATRVGGAIGLTPPQFDNLIVIPSYVKSSSNPTTQIGVSGSWEDVDVAAPDVFYDSPHNRWVMDYSGFDGTTWKTGLAYCVGDLKTCSWTKEVANPVMSPLTSEGYILGSGAITYNFKDKLYYYIYQSAPGQISGGPLTNWRIYLASSPDLLVWTRLNSGNPILPLGAAASFDQDGQHDPSYRLRDDGWYEMFFAGRNGSLFKAGHAFSKDLIHWTTTTELPVGATQVSNLAVDGTNSTNYALYFIRNYLGFRYIVRADTTDDGATFQSIGGSLYKGALTWDSAQVFDPMLITVGNITYMFYSGGTSPGGTENLNAGIGFSYTILPTNNPAANPSTWINYTPTITSESGTITTVGTTTGKYKLVDNRTVDFQISTTITTNGTGAGKLRVTLPFTATGNDFSCNGIDKNANKSLACITQASGTFASATLYDGTYPAADGKTLLISGRYEMIP